MNTVRYYLVFLLVFLGAGLNAQAAMISGKVEAYDESTRKVTLSSEDPVSGKSVKTEVWMDSNAKIEQFSPSGIQPGERVWIDAETDSEGNLRAGSISKA